MISQSIIEELTARVVRSVDRVYTEKEDRMIETEPSLTDRLLANIGRDFEDQGYLSANQHVKIAARTLQDRGKNSAEKKYGADLATVLDISIDEYSIRKGILAQSKRINKAMIYPITTELKYENGGFVAPNPYGLRHPSMWIAKTGIIQFSFVKADFDRLKDQCEKMLQVTPDSFVFLYCEDEILVIPASAVQATTAYKSPLEFHFKNFKGFFTDYLASFIGDINLQGTNDEDFKRIMTDTDSRSLLYLLATDR